MTVLEAIKKGAEFLERKGIESSRLQSELLLAHLLHLPRLRLYLEFERNLPEQQSDAFRQLLVKRGAHVPLQHLIGSTSFCGFHIDFSPDVLIPRPETEMLAEQGWQFLNSLSRETTFLDLGTGSGCIPIAILGNAKNTNGLAIDISEAALTIAKANAEKNEMQNRLEFRNSDLFSKVSEQFDLIVSNPPYIATAEIETLQSEVRDHDPRLALDGGPDGLEFYRKLAHESAKHLKPGGRLMLEFGDNQAEAIGKIFAEHEWKIHVLRDLSQRERMLIAER